VIQKSKSLKHEPFSEPPHISAKKLFLNQEPENRYVAMVVSLPLSEAEFTSDLQERLYP